MQQSRLFLTKQCPSRRTNLCKVVSVETPARNPNCDAENFAYTRLFSLKWHRISLSNHFSWKEGFREGFRINEKDLAFRIIGKDLASKLLSEFGEKFTCAFCPCRWLIAVSQACLKNDMVISFQLIPTFLKQYWIEPVWPWCFEWLKLVNS